MAEPLVIDLPHTLGAEEAKRRMRERVGALGSFVPGGAATVNATWPSESRMALEVAALGQTVSGTADVTDSNVRLTLVLPGMLAMMSGPIASAIRGEGSKLLLGVDKA
jgi:hypothetical protein